MDLKKKKVFIDADLVCKSLRKQPSDWSTALKAFFYTKVLGQEHWKDVRGSLLLYSDIPVRKIILVSLIWSWPYGKILGQGGRNSCIPRIYIYIIFHKEIMFLLCIITCYHHFFFYKKTSISIYGTLLYPFHKLRYWEEIWASFPNVT